MSQILRVIKPEINQICRFYAGRRNVCNHYETLRVPQDASQKDIRQAFLKLSKEMHPDTSNKTSHKDFVEISEAYQVLSRQHTRDKYDMELEYNARGGMSSSRVMYTDAQRQWNPYQGPTMHTGNPNYNGDDYYGIKGIKRKSNGTIALLCIIFSAVGLAIQLLAINKSLVFQREDMMERSAKLQELYQSVRREAEVKTKEEQILAFREKFERQQLEIDSKVED